MPPSKSIPVNGCTRTKHPLQILSTIYFIQLVTCISIIIAPIINLLVQIILCVLFYSLAVAIVYFALKTSLIDPTDDIILRVRNGELNNNDQDLYDFFCSFCDSYVSSTTKHCKVCDRCVSDFDHHCKWLNNCIGKKNYDPFFKLLLSVTAFSILFVIFAIFTNRILKRNLQIWLWVNVGCVGILLLFNFNLMAFHFWLRLKNMTTYEYIIKRRQATIRRAVDVESSNKFCCTSTKTTPNLRQVNPQNVDPSKDDIKSNENSKKQQQNQSIQIQQSNNLQIQADIESDQDQQQQRKSSVHTLNSQFSPQQQINQEDDQK